jgi:hypothetical protein
LIPGGEANAMWQQHDILDPLLLVGLSALVLLVIGIR